MTDSGFSSAAAPAPEADLQPRRRWLWIALLLLVLPLLGVLVFLADQFEEGRDQSALDADAQALSTDFRNALVRNVQTLQSLFNVGTTPANWSQQATEVLIRQREMVRLEWRGADMQLVAESNTPYLGDLFGYFDRDQALTNVRETCEGARRGGGPVYSSSYFWPMKDGLGMELMEMCLPILRNGQMEGYLVATYSLPGILDEFSDRDLVRGRGLSFVDTDGTRLALHSLAPSRRRLLVARTTIELPGHSLLLDLEGPRRRVGGALGLPNVLTAAVGVLSLALLAVLGMLGRDMRLRQRAEHELDQALAFRKAMENSLVTGLRARDMAGRITYVNPAFCEMLGLKPEELLGTGLPSPWWPPELVDEYQRRHAVRLAGQALPREGYESVFQRRDGTRFPVLIIEAPLIDAQGVQTGYMSAILDLSEQRRVEELNRASQERLQATARLATVGEMASLLSHELNQPLAAIASYASGAINLLDEPEGDAAELVPDLRVAMQRIGEQAERAGRVVRSVGDFVRRRERVREAVAPATLIEAIQPLLALQAKKMDIRLDIRVSPDCASVLCDRTMIEQVLLNLARNGMQAMPLNDPPSDSGLRVLTITVGPVRPMARSDGETEWRGKTWVEFGVTDRGHGLNDDVRQQLFTPFFTTRTEGMGLGLSLCRTVIEQHGGALDFEPAAPRGTRFRFTLAAA